MVFRVLLVSLLALLSCQPNVHEQQATFKPYHHVYDSANTLFWQTLSDNRSSISTLSFDSSWRFRLGDSFEQLKTIAKLKGGEIVNLPHRLEKPGTAFWYTREIHFSTKGILAIHADDGAQLFINEKQVSRVNDIYFPIDTVGRMLVTIRVLNNAMSGGLNNVVFFTTQQFQQHSNHQDNTLRFKKLVEKITLLNQPSTQIIDLVQIAIRSKDEASIVSAEKALEQFPFLTGPWLQTLNNRKWTIKFIADKNIPVTLVYGESPSEMDYKITRQGEVVSFILNLQPNQHYFYRVTSGRTISPVYTFQTNDETSSFSFTAWADSQSGWEVFQQNILNTVEHKDAFSIGVGDLVANGSDEEEWRMLFNTIGISSAERPYYLIAGNHDHDGYYDNLEPVLYNKFINPSSYFSWTYGNCAFIALNPNEIFPIGIQKGSNQYTWFHNQLESPMWKQATWRFILLHQPPYSQGWPGYHGDKVIRDLLEPVIEKAKIDFVISGHTHDYERLTRRYGKQQTTYLIVGGGGGSLEPTESSNSPKMDTIIKVHHMGRFHVEGDSILFKVIDSQNQIIDSFDHSHTRSN